MEDTHREHESIEEATGDIGPPTALTCQQADDLEGERAELDLQATNRRGKQITCRVTVTPLTAPTGEVDGAILLMEVV